MNDPQAVSMVVVVAGGDDTEDVEWKPSCDGGLCIHTNTHTQAGIHHDTAACLPDGKGMKRGERLGVENGRNGRKNGCVKMGAGEGEEKSREGWYEERESKGEMKLRGEMVVVVVVGWRVGTIISRGWMKSWMLRKWKGGQCKANEQLDGTREYKSYSGKKWRPGEEPVKSLYTHTHKGRVKEAL